MTRYPPCPLCVHGAAVHTMQVFRPLSAVHTRPQLPLWSYEVECTCPMRCAEAQRCSPSPYLVVLKWLQPFPTPPLGVFVDRSSSIWFVVIDNFLCEMMPPRHDLWLLGCTATTSRMPESERAATRRDHPRD